MEPPENLNPDFKTNVPASVGVDLSGRIRRRSSGLQQSANDDQNPTFQSNLTKMVRYIKRIDQKKNCFFKCVMSV